MSQHGNVRRPAPCAELPEYPHRIVTPMKIVSLARGGMAVDPGRLSRFHKTYANLCFMKEPSPMLLPLLRSRAQGDVCAWIMLHPNESFSLREIADAIGVSSPTVMREVDRLEDAGLISVSRSGNQRLVRADTSTIVYRPLAELMAVTFGPLPVLRDSLAEVPGIRRAFIYGSWAARYAQQPGAVAGDIDVLVVGDPGRHELDEVAETAQRILHREVNIRRVTTAAWDAMPADDPFKSTVMSRPIVDLVEPDLFGSQQ